MKIKIFWAVAIALSCVTSASFASKQDHCQVFYEKFYKNCYKYGHEKQSIKACEKVTEEMEKALLDEADNIKEEGIASFLASVCDGACQSAVNGEAVPSYGDFQEQFCK